MKGFNILMVDDDRGFLEAFATVFEEAGFTVCCVESGEDALRIMAERNFSLISTDMNMPAMNGLELTKMVRKMDPEVPVIMLTASLSPLISLQAKEAGVSCVLPKTLGVNEILDIVRVQLGKVRA